MTSAAPAVVPDLAAQLEQLRDIHLPPGISWWPPAPGWWAIAVAVIVIAFAAVVIVFVRRRTVRYRALKELNNLRRDDSLDVVPAAEQIEILLKRIVLQKDETKSLGAEHGSPWIERLMQVAGGMSAEIARFIALAPYAGTNLIDGVPDRAALFAAADLWIRRNA